MFGNCTEVKLYAEGGLHTDVRPKQCNHSSCSNGIQGRKDILSVMNYLCICFVVGEKQPGCTAGPSKGILLAVAEGVKFSKEAVRSGQIVKAESKAAVAVAQLLA